MSRSEFLIACGHTLYGLRFENPVELKLLHDAMGKSLIQGMWHWRAN